MHSKELPRSHGVLPDNLLTLPCYIIYLKDLASLGCMRSLHLRNRGSITVNHVISVPPSLDQNELLENNWRITKFKGLFLYTWQKMNSFITWRIQHIYIYCVNWQNYWKKHIIFSAKFSDYFLSFWDIYCNPYQTARHSSSIKLGFWSQELIKGPNIFCCVFSPNYEKQEFVQ